MLTQTRNKSYGSINSLMTSKHPEAFATCRSRSSTEAVVVFTPLEPLELIMVSELEGFGSVHKLAFPLFRVGEPGGLLFEEPNADEKEVCKLKMEEVLMLKSLENRSKVVEVGDLKSKEELSKAERLGPDSSFW
ncbi:unnamed protein product [Rhizophagus irregularis]|nr:unnamed protein product [Rhizophagus irregularis]